VLTISSLLDYRFAVVSQKKVLKISVDKVCHPRITFLEIKNVPMAATAKIKVLIGAKEQAAL
jgi:hypothetical protein